MTIYAVYEVACGIYGFGGTPEEAIEDATELAESVGEDATRAELVPWDHEDGEADLDKLLIRRCTEELAAAYYSLGEAAPCLCYEINNYGVLDLFRI